MRTIKIISLLIISLVLSTVIYGQGRHGGNHGNGNHGNGNHGNGNGRVKGSPFRPNKIYVYHPSWHKNHSYNRRWVFFPKYNIYWDNWRNHYMFYNGTVWLSQSTPPPVIVNVNLVDEKHYELKENDDDNDEINSANTNHKSEYKPD